MNTDLVYLPNETEFQPLYPRFYGGWLAVRPPRITTATGKKWWALSVSLSDGHHRASHTSNRTPAAWFHWLDSGYTMSVK
jgi:hypothetical protein